MPPMPPSADASPEDLAWVTARRGPQPRKTFEQPVRLTGAVERLPRVYIKCLRINPSDVFEQFAARARTEPGWQYEEIDATHSPNVAAPDKLAEILLRVAADCPPSGSGHGGPEPERQTSDGGAACMTGSGTIAAGSIRPLWSFGGRSVTRRISS